MAFLSKKKSKKLNRIFFATDVHGSERTYRKFINAGKFYYNLEVVSLNFTQHF